MSMTSQPASSFPATASHGNPAGRRGDQRPDVRPGPGPRPGDPVAASRGQASSSVRRTVVSDGAAPSTGARWASTLDVAHARRAERDRHRHRHQRHPPVHQRGLPRPRQRRAQARGQAGPGPRACAAAPPRHARSGRPRPRSPSGHGPTAYAAWRRALQSRKLRWCGYLVISQGQGALRCQGPRMRRYRNTNPARAPAGQGAAPGRCTPPHPATRHPAAKHQLTAPRKTSAHNSQVTLNTGG